MTNEVTTNYMELFDNALIGIFHSTFDGKFLYANKAFSTILKYSSPEEVILSINDIQNQLFTRDYNWQDILAQMRRDGKLANYEVQYYCKDGSIINALLNMHIKKDMEGNELYIEGFISDISSLKIKEQKLKESEQMLQEVNEELEASLQQLTANEEILRYNYDQIKEKEAALIESEQRWNFALEGSVDGVWDWNLETNSVYRSKQYKTMRGFAETDITDSYEQWLDMIHPEDREWVVDELHKHVNNETPIYIAEYRILRKDGSYMWVHERSKATKRALDGRALRMVGTHRDVTKERNYQDALLLQKKSFECLFDNSIDAIVEFDEEEHIIDINTEFVKLFGYTFEEVKGKYINDIIDPFNEMESYLTFAGLEKGDCQFRDTVRYDKHGNPIKVFVKGVPIVINNKTVGGYAIYTDVRFIKDAEDQIRKQKKILESLFKYSPDAIVDIDMNRKITNINHTFTELFGYTIDECVGKTVDELIVSEEYIPESQMINNIAFENQKVEVDTVRKHKDNTLIDVCVRGGPTFVEGRIIGYHGIYTDIRARKEAEAKIRYLSYHDKLTGLYNRAFFEEELKRLDTDRQLPLAIIIGDVNGLKLTNDVFGHLTGDKLLAKTADILKKACRKEDIICRWGGDEFAILLPHTDKNIVDKICERIYCLSKESADTPIQIGISLGYAIKYKNEPMTELIKEAEERMYRNKLLESKSTRSHIINSLQKSLYERSHETETHCQRMKDLSIALGKSLNLDNDKINELGLLALLHDIGKMAISDSILQKPGKLTLEEWEKMKRHSEIGYRIAETSPELAHISKYILFHHERWDGTGYPKGLKGDEIPLLSRIISVVDVYDVMTNARVYKAPVSHDEALKEIVRCSGTQFDPEVVGKFLELFSLISGN
ncbi:sensor domain-containing diguanylate cyclase/phosphohydrolase [Anaerosolibacter sp.]|uniref:sensor domain-containing diguanylate cyclase/phosphohydrolase n=1 Tax=Anaerosolibacter sp. TaxID=1872527 RepID=UPI0039EF8FD5